MSFTKYDGSPHWCGDLTLLGADRFGRWLGGAPGTIWRRPGRTVDAGAHWVSLVPYDGRYVATFNSPESSLSAQVYVDLTDVPVWSRGEPGDRLRVDAVDLDLDVVRRFCGACAIDDVDEFETHRVALGYPAGLVASTMQEAERLLREVSRGGEPYGQVGTDWLTAWRSGEVGRPIIRP